MAIIDSATQGQAEDLGLAARKASQGLTPYTDGTASPGTNRVGPYTPDEVDAYVEEFQAAAIAAGYPAVVAPGDAVVGNGDTVDVRGFSGTAVVVDNELQGVTLPGILGLVPNGTELVGDTHTVVLSVVDGVVSIASVTENASP